MASVELALDEDIVQVLHLLDQPLPQAARELMVMELYRRELISSGKAAELLGMSTRDFIEHAGALGIPYFRTSIDEVKADADSIRDVARKG